MNTFVLWLQRFTNKHFSKYGLRPFNAYTRSAAIYPVIGCGIVFTVMLGNYVFNIGPRATRKIQKDKKDYYSYLKQYNLPSDFDPIDNKKHLNQFSKAKNDIIRDRLGEEVDNAYNPFKPEYYLHTLPPKNKHENLLWMQKPRNWDDYNRWIAEKHPKELEQIKSGK